MTIAMIFWSAVFPAIASGIRLHQNLMDKNVEDPKVNLMVDTNYGSSDVDSGDEWPDKWVDATAHGRWIAHLLDNDTLYDFLYAKSGAYEGQTIPLPDFGVPALKMASAIPGWKPKTAEEAKRVTSFPSYLALASSWDPYLVEEVAIAVAEEFKTLGANMMLGPAINVHRATQHHENFDSLSGEDPILGSVLTRMWCLAVHSRGIITVPKFLGKMEQVPVHYDNVTANITAWDVFYPPFEAAVDSGAAGVMCDASEVDGMWACRDMNVLSRDLKELMGFQGMVLTDHGAAMNYFPDPQPTTFERGADLFLNEPDANRLPPTSASVQAMQKAAAHVLAAIWHLRIDDESCELPCAKERKSVATSPAHSNTAKKAAASAVIMLKNEEDLLPLTKDKVQVVGLLGPAAAAPPKRDTPLDGDYFTGYNEEHVDKAMFSPSYGIWSRGKDKGIKVVQGTQGADVCVVVGGSKRHTDHWRADPETLDAVADAVANCTKVIVCLQIMGAVLTPWRNQVGAIMAMFHGGEETAFGWAATLFGDATPAAKLPLSMPAAEQATAEYWKEPLPSYWSSSFNAAFPFGHGLSYASFIYQDFKVKSRCRFPLCVVATVMNSHPTMSGSEVVQVYFKFDQHPDHPVVLRGFYKTKVLKPGQQEKAFFHFNHRDISLYWDRSGKTIKEDSWAPQDSLTVLFGSSSTDIRGELRVNSIKHS
uniref:Probable beta-glucosidase G n=1 Tax=Alexandrium catenella TaxID=2925 RepID=A0A7S1PNU4_ALECA|mmetsp:Transcript_105362/g.280542  ORF Transcript_105362/g.280542 Transcript_105362/m.280542 type:complete len:705 (+) Transcript_105362:57-2171(+)